MKIFIDLGAFDGRISYPARDKGYEVYSFEPNERINLEGVNFIRAAAWNEDGVAPLYERNERDTSDMSLSLIKEKTNIDKNRYQEVKTINFGKWLKDLDKDIDVLKMNVEGAEYYIIESILDNFDYKRIKEWFVEDHSQRIASIEWQNHRQKVLDRMDELGIKVENWRYNAII